MSTATDQKTLTEITVWTRGVIMDKEARDVANALAAGAALEGKYVQSFDNYVDLPDRVNVPLRKYARISDHEIETKYVYENDHPDIVVVVEPTIVKGVNILRGMKKGYLIVNTNRSPEEILKFIPDKSLLKAIATVDADSISAGKKTIDLMSNEGGFDTTGMGAGIAAPLIGAAAKVAGIAKVDSLTKVVKDASAMKRGYDEVKVVIL